MKKINKKLFIGIALLAITISGAINIAVTNNRDKLLSVFTDNIEALASSEEVYIDCGKYTGKCWKESITEYAWCNPYTKVKKQTFTGLSIDSYTDCSNFY